LCVRGYWWTDAICGRVSATSVVGGTSFWCSLIVGACEQDRWDQKRNWTLRTWPSGQALRFRDSNPQPRICMGFGVYKNASDFWVMIPYWFLVVAIATLGTAPWIRKLRWRFSLRTLLIATTLIGVVLGLIVWLSHH
jgi:hypothetical protein